MYRFMQQASCIFMFANCRHDAAIGAGALNMPLLASRSSHSPLDHVSLINGMINGRDRLFVAHGSSRVTRIARRTAVLRVTAEHGLCQRTAAPPAANKLAARLASGTRADRIRAGDPVALAVAAAATVTTNR